MSEQFRPFGRKAEADEESARKQVPRWGTFGQANPPTMDAPNFKEELYGGQEQVLSIKEIEDIESNNNLQWHDDNLSVLLSRLRGLEAILAGDSGPGKRDMANDIDLLQCQIKRRVSQITQAK